MIEAADVKIAVLQVALGIKALVASALGPSLETGWRSSAAAHLPFLAIFGHQSLRRSGIRK